MKNRILIVDDAYINRELLKEMLSENYEILEAENGKEALDIVENEKHINGILLDLVMPVMDGFELLENGYNGQNTGNDNKLGNDST